MMEKLPRFARLSAALLQQQALLSNVEKKQAGLGTVVPSKQAGFWMRSCFPRLLSCLLRRRRCWNAGVSFHLPEA